MQDFINPETQEMNAVIKELREYELLQKELKLRIDSIKRNITQRVKKTNNSYLDSDYSIELKEISSKRLDSTKVKNYFIKNDLDLADFQTESKSERLQIKRL